MSNPTRIASLVKDLVSKDPSDPSIVDALNKLSSEMGLDSKPLAGDPDTLLQEVRTLHKAATVPAKNYARVASITSDLARAIEISRRPQYAALRPHIANILQRLAGIFAQVDLAEDISSHTLEEIETAVHKLYSNGAQNKPNTFNFEARGVGHRGK